ncbi:sporulation protein YqfD [Clostridium sediminicola]|uniref:sporulation protein YqfD n=1 Tax=Clostridium sediminicola TaxID=3114879 RepID=UPI0031F1E90C
MSKFNFKRYKNGIITIEIISRMPEKFLNLLWKNRITVKNVRKKNLTTIYAEINLKDYRETCNLAKRAKAKIKIIDRKGISFMLLKLNRRKTIAVGVFVFVSLIYYLSTFIWGIKINTEKNVSPFEVRQTLLDIGIRPGMAKSKLNTISIEEKLIKTNDSIMWVRARIEGSQLIVSVAERQAPPVIEVDNEPSNLIASKDGVIERVYTNSGTAVVEYGQVVKEGELLVKGEQGKEGSTYEVHAEADVIAKTFYEKKSLIPKKIIKKEKTGECIEEIYIKIGKNKFFIKKAKNIFKNYDKIVNSKSLYTKVTYYEINQKNIDNDINSSIDKTVEELSSKIIMDIDKTVTIKDRIINQKDMGDSIEVSVILVCEENIAVSQKLSVSDVNEN